MPMAEMQISGLRLRASEREAPKTPTCRVSGRKELHANDETEN